MITGDQIAAHLVGDYLFQSHWMAQRKGRDSLAAGIHVATYTLPFALLTFDPLALALIASSHFLVDRFRLARFVVWAKNRPWPGGAECDWHTTGYPPDAPAWLAVWLLIIADNTLHLLCNGLALLLVTVA